jgi:hypothetical protein
MLRRFLYLDTSALTDYLSAVEGGTRESLARRSLTTGKSEGSVDAKLAKGGIGRTKENEESLTLADTAHAQFERLLKLMNDDPESAGWLEVMDSDTDLQSAGIGMMADFECDIYIPDTIRAATQMHELAGAIDAMEALLPSANALGLDTSGLPSKDEIDAVKGFGDLSKLFSESLVVVGDLDDSDWRIAGRLKQEHVNSDIDGRARVVGKISAKWPSGKWKPLLALPGSTLISREQRRRMERQRPEPGEEENFLEGPAVMLDVLAIYR